MPWLFKFIVISILVAVMWFAYDHFLKHLFTNRHRYILITMDEDDNESFFKVIKMLRMEGAEGYEYDDSTDVIFMKIRVKPNCFDKVFSRLNDIENIEVMEGGE